MGSFLNALALKQALSKDPKSVSVYGQRKPRLLFPSVGIYMRVNCFDISDPIINTFILSDLMSDKYLIVALIALPLFYKFTCLPPICNGSQLSRNI